MCYSGECPYEAWDGDCSQGGLVTMYGCPCCETCRYQFGGTCQNKHSQYFAQYVDQKDLCRCSLYELKFTNLIGLYLYQNLNVYDLVRALNKIQKIKEAEHEE
jgi:hypothetical protein